eukprot:16623-Heterococcus_DN1.PRE.1
MSTAALQSARGAAVLLQMSTAAQGSLQTSWSVSLVLAVESQDTAVSNSPKPWHNCRSCRAEEYLMEQQAHTRLLDVEKTLAIAGC